LTVPRAGVSASLLCAVAMLIVLAQPAVAQDGDHFLEYSADDFKVVFMSGNFTTYILFDWPSVAFEHSGDWFSSTFQVSLPVIYLFNDTDGNGIFTRSEAIYYGYLDTMHLVAWNVTDVVFLESDGGSEQALVGLWTVFGLFDGPEAIEPVIEDWGRLTVWYSISESPVTYSNSMGNYVVDGKLDLRLNLSLEILKPLNCSGVALEQDLKGGWGDDVFLLTEEDEHGDVNSTEVLVNVDETEYGDAFAHRFRQTQLPTQRIDFVKEDWTAQAHYKLSSVPMANHSGESAEVSMNCSYYTTGSEMVLHTAYFLPNDTSVMTHDLSLGIDEAGFYTGVRDWFSENLAVILIATGTVATIISVVVLLLMYRKMRKSGGSWIGSSENRSERPPKG